MYVPVVGGGVWIRAATDSVHIDHCVFWLDGYLQVLRLRAISTVCLFDVGYLQVLAADRRRAPLGRVRARRARARHGQLVAAQSARPRSLPALVAGAQRVEGRSVGRHRDCRSGEGLTSFAVGTSVTYMYMSMYM